MPGRYGSSASNPTGAMYSAAIVVTPIDAHSHLRGWFSSGQLVRDEVCLSHNRVELRQHAEHTAGDGLPGDIDCVLVPGVAIVLTVLLVAARRRAVRLPRRWRSCPSMCSTNLRLGPHPRPRSAVFSK
jgi:hypothetical protein